MNTAMDKQPLSKARARETAQDFSKLNLSPNNFHAFYIKFINLRFPVMVSHLIELRYLVNHAVDKYKEPPLTADYRQFRDSLQAAVDSFIDNPRYRERMLLILSMFRNIHYHHSIISRNAELELRSAMATNRAQHARFIRYGLFFIFAGVSSGIAWLATIEPTLFVKLLPAIYGTIAWNYFHKLPGLDQQHENLTLELNDVLRRRVESLNWKTLIHKLALVLGYKRVQGVEVFHIDQADQHAYH